MFKMASVVLYAQLCSFKKIIIFLRSDNFIISPYAVTRLHCSPHLYTKETLKVKVFHSIRGYEVPEGE